MRLTPFALISTALAALVLAACGSSKKSSTTPSTGGPSSSTATTTTKPGHSAKPKRRSAPARTYRLKLSGKVEVPKGAPKGTGAAVIALHPSSDKVCWRFTHLHGFAEATFAHVHKGKTGQSGNIVVPLSTGAKLKHAGCASTSAATIKAIEKDPHGYYVNIHSKKYPGGAVRAQL